MKNFLHISYGLFFVAGLIVLLTLRNLYGVYFCLMAFATLCHHMEFNKETYSFFYDKYGSIDLTKLSERVHIVANIVLILGAWQIMENSAY